MACQPVKGYFKPTKYAIYNFYLHILSSCTKYLTVRIFKTALNVLNLNNHINCKKQQVLTNGNFG